MKKILLGFCLFLNCLPALAQNKTPDYWKCDNRVGGAWNFGRAPSACDASSFGSDQFIWSNFNALVFRDQKETVEERLRYMTDLHATLRDAGTYYYQTRNPSASREEIQGWLQAVFTIAHQESYWSHYRYATDERLKMMRGDFGHGHGLMQVDDRWHFVAIGNGAGWGLLDNFSYGLDEYYGNWVKSVKQVCVKSPTDWRARARTAYSAYNGGATKACRWTTQSVWSRNDEGYVDKYDSSLWRQFVRNTQAVSPVDAPCLMEKRSNCAQPQPPSKPVMLTPQSLAVFSNGQVCRLLNGTLACVATAKDKGCLSARETLPEMAGRDEWLTQYKAQIWDRHELCRANIPGLIPVGRALQTLTSTPLMATPKGAVIGTVAAGTKLQVLDFEIAGLEVIYTVQVSATQTGAISGRVMETQSAPVLSIAQPGDSLRVAISGGLNLRQKPDGSILTALPTGTVVQVLSTTVMGDDNRVYYMVQSPTGHRGYLFSGRLLPESTLSQWTTRIKK